MVQPPRKKKLKKPSVRAAGTFCCFPDGAYHVRVEGSQHWTVEGSSGTWEGVEKDSRRCVRGRNLIDVIIEGKDLTL